MARWCLLSLTALILLVVWGFTQGSPLQAQANAYASALAFFADYLSRKGLEFPAPAGIIWSQLAGDQLQIRLLVNTNPKIATYGGESKVPDSFRSCQSIIDFRQDLG